MGMRSRKIAAVVALLLGSFAGGMVYAQAEPLQLKIERSGPFQPMPIAIPMFVPESGGSQDLAARITQVVVDDLVNSGLFREIPRDAHVTQVSDFNTAPQFTDWTAINAQALITGSASATSDGRIVVKFRLWDVVANQQLGEGQQFVGTADGWRRMAHKVADQVYSRLTGESGYFDSRVAFVSVSGPKGARRNQLAVMDQDGANVRYLTPDTDIVLTPRWSPDNRSVLYTSYESGAPKVYLMNVDTLQKQTLGNLPGVTFAPRFSPDGRKVVLSLSEGANTDIYTIDLSTGQRTRLTEGSSIETAPSFSPDGSQIVFESDRSGTQQIYVMSAGGGAAQRISSGEGRYATPVWSPRGDLVAFTKILSGRFHIGVMPVTGGDERLLTSSYIDEAPSWSPNGRVVTFFRETPGESGAPALYAVDLSGKIPERRLPTPSFASDPNWSNLLQ